MNEYLSTEFAKWKATNPTLNVELSAQDLRKAAQKLKNFDGDASPKELTAEFASFILQLPERE